MDQASIIQYVTDTFAGVDVVRPEERGGPEIAHGDTFFIYDPERNLPPTDQLPFATIVTKDYGDFDRASNLDRPGVFRLNVGVEKESFRALFGHAPSGGADAGYDFTALDRLMPHPVYAAQCWVSILNPGDATFQQQVRPLLAKAYELATARHARRQARR
jgi:hypothetical protein